MGKKERGKERGKSSSSFPFLPLLYFGAPEAKKEERRSGGDHGGLRGWTPIEEEEGERESLLLLSGKERKGEG